MATESIKLPAFMVTTVAPNNSPARDPDTGAYEGLYQFDIKSTQGTEPVYLLDLKYDGNLDKDKKGDGTFSGTAVSQTTFTEALAKKGQDLVFFIHGFRVHPRDMITSTNEMQENFHKAAIKVSGEAEPFVVPVDWVCSKTPLNIPLPSEYKKDQETSKQAGLAIYGLVSGGFFSSLKQTGQSPKIHVVAHSMVWQRPSNTLAL